MHENAERLLAAGTALSAMHCFEGWPGSTWGLVSLAALQCTGAPGQAPPSQTSLFQPLTYTSHTSAFNVGMLGSILRRTFQFIHFQKERKKRQISNLELDDTAQCNGVGCKTFQETIIVWNWLLGHTCDILHIRRVSFDAATKRELKLTTLHKNKLLDDQIYLHCEEQIVWTIWNKLLSGHIGGIVSTHRLFTHVAPQRHIWLQTTCGTRSHVHLAASTQVPKYQVHMNSAGNTWHSTNA